MTNAATDRHFLNTTTYKPMNEPTTIDTTAVAVREPQPVSTQAMGVREILDQVKLIQEVMHSVMVENEHFGKIPGCGDKKVLLQPGAQKLTMTFRLAPEYQIQEVNLDRGHKEYRIICTLKSMTNGNFVGQGVGACSTMESKYRFHGGSRKCPECGKETIIKGKKEYGGGWLCFAKKGGCGAKWPDGAVEIESQSVEKVENDNPADHYNTVLKMAKKRAFVDATITATAASDIFTQDIGDNEESGQEQPIPAQQTPSRDKFLSAFIGRIVEQSLLNAAEAMFKSCKAIGPNDTIEDLPLNQVPKTKEEFESVMAEIRQYAATTTDQLPGAEVPESMDSEGNRVIRGYIASTNSKETKKGTSRYGICIRQSVNGDDKGLWVNTFSKVDFEKAGFLSNDGKKVEVKYSLSQFGNTLVSIQEVA